MQQRTVIYDPCQIPVYDSFEKSNVKWNHKLNITALPINWKSLNTYYKVIQNQPMLECEENYTQSFLQYKKIHTIFSQNCISEVFQAKYQWSIWSVSYSYWKTHYLGIKIHNKESRFMMLDNFEHSQCGMLTKINMHKLNFQIKPKNQPAIVNESLRFWC